MVSLIASPQSLFLQKSIDETLLFSVYCKRSLRACILVNDHGDVPLDEAGPCYKPSEQVLAAVVKAGLATVQYRLWPLASLKGLN